MMQEADFRPEDLGDLLNNPQKLLHFLYTTCGLTKAGVEDALELCRKNPRKALACANAASKRGDLSTAVKFLSVTDFGPVDKIRILNTLAKKTIRKLFSHQHTGKPQPSLPNELSNAFRVFELSNRFLSISKSRSK